MLKITCHRSFNEAGGNLTMDWIHTSFLENSGQSQPSPCLSSPSHATINSLLQSAQKWKSNSNLKVTSPILTN